MKVIHSNLSITHFILRILQGTLIGLGAILPGISGGVLCVVFGIYKPIMELMSNPIKNFKTHIPKLLPVIIGIAVGFLGVANMLSFFLNKHPAPSVCLFAGLIVGMLPSLFKEANEKGHTKGSFIAMFISAVLIFAVLCSLSLASVSIIPNTGWYIFCGFSLALSVIAPGMSFSTLLMPLGLYTPFINGISHFDFSVIFPCLIGALSTVICFSKAINYLFDKHYSVTFHSIIGVVISATIMIIPYKSFLSSPNDFLINTACLVSGIIVALILDCFNNNVSKA